jgi:hypothetical protein
MSGIQNHQAPSSVSDNKGCDCKYQDNRHVPIFEEEAYEIIITLENTILQLGNEFSIFRASYFH